MEMNAIIIVHLSKIIMNDGDMSKYMIMDIQPQNLIVAFIPSQM